MSIQDRTALALQALSIIDGTPPHPLQPRLRDGIYLRWFFGENRGFPLKGRYYLFRRRVGGTNCLMPLLQGQTPSAIAKVTSLSTTIGTLIAVPLGDASGQDLKPLPAGSSTSGIQGFTIDQQGLQFSLPVKPSAVTVSQFTVRLRFTPSGSAAPAVSQPQTCPSAHSPAL
jgi:hypothetical protein